MAKARGMTVKDRTGERYGRLTVLWREANRVEPSGAVRAQWRCLCDCGGAIVVSGQGLSRGHTRSCGCLQREKVPKHGMSRTKVYRNWVAMRQRCENPNHQHYHLYGGAGKTVCERWKDFVNFYADVGDCPPGMTLDRIDGSRGYEPGNVRWASRQQQANNRIDNVFLTHAGQTMTLAEWGRVSGLGKAIVTMRYRLGWPPERLLTEPPRRR